MNDLENMLHLYEYPTDDEKAECIVNNEIYNDVSKIEVDGIIKETILNDRYYLHTIPDNKEQHDLILFYHGSRDIAWTQVLEYTNLKHTKYIIAFGQASGTIHKPEIHPHYGYASFGEIFWEINDSEQQFDEDLLYTKAIVNDMKDQYNINNVYFIGHSNGGVFALLLALYTPNMFKGIVSHAGGIGYDPRFYLDFKLLKSTDNKTPLLFYTGENDLHRFPCEAAHNIFLGKHFPIVDIFIEKDMKHEYKSSCESYMLNWLESLK
jgi:predicted esterase